ncbi:MAG: 2-oxo acid dehydrogenase subunit E2 [Armatimonadota bacterium]
MPTPMRQAIARHMTYSKQNIPHYYLTVRPDISAALGRREDWNLEHAKEESVSINDLVLKATALALVKHPEFNGYYQENELRAQPHVNLGVAIALEDGLIAPAILHCEGLSLLEIGRSSRDLAERARQRVLKAEEYTAATFTITNLGMYKVDSFAAIIVPPQVGILAVGGVAAVPVVVDGEIMTAHQMALTLSGDHRATDGAEGAQFLNEIVAGLQDPDRLFA